MHKTIIHIGLHKTGSTYLQREVFPTLQNYTLITRPYTQWNHFFNKLQHVDNMLYSKEEIEDELVSRVKSENVLFSDEGFSGKPWKGFNYVNRSMVLDRLKELFPSAEIVLVIRNQDAMLRSFYNQYLRGGGINHLKDYVWKSNQSLDLASFMNKGAAGYSSKELMDLSYLYANTNGQFINPDVFDYHSLIKFCKSLFESVHVLLYEEMKEDPKSFSSRISGIFGEKLELPNIYLNKSSYISKGTMVANRLNQILGDNVKSRRVLQRLLKNFGRIKEVDALLSEDLMKSNGKLIEYVSEDKLKEYGYLTENHN